MGVPPSPRQGTIPHDPRQPVRRWVFVARVLGALAIVGAVVFVLAIKFINYMFDASSVPRPAGLPATAVLVGTLEHYEFIDCVPRGSDQYDCTMFTGGGDPFAIGRFRSTDNIDLRDAGSYWFDGSTVRLSTGRRLEPVEPVRLLTFAPASPRGARTDAFAP